MPTAITTSIVDSPASVSSLIVTLDDPATTRPSLYLDLEGINLSRSGSISIVEILVHPKNHVYLIDIHTLGASAFSIAASNGHTLKSILESPTIPKVFFDVRNDFNALFAHFGISLQGVHDIQLMENASRGRHISGKKLVNGLAKCIKEDAPISFQQKRTWEAVKEKGKKLFDPQKGGSYDVFNTRPLRDEIKMYCVQDVQFLPCLYRIYAARLEAKVEWKGKAEVETKKRVLLSQSKLYEPHGSDKALDPWQSTESLRSRLKTYLRSYTLTMIHLKTTITMILTSIVKIWRTSLALEQTRDSVLDSGHW